MTLISAADKIDEHEETDSVYIGNVGKDMDHQKMQKAVHAQTGIDLSKIVAREMITRPGPKSFEVIIPKGKQNVVIRRIKEKHPGLTVQVYIPKRSQKTTNKSRGGNNRKTNVNNNQHDSFRNDPNKYNGYQQHYRHRDLPRDQYNHDTDRRPYYQHQADHYQQTADYYRYDNARARHY